jgi:hypothetical protein
MRVQEYNHLYQGISWLLYVHLWFIIVRLFIRMMLDSLMAGRNYELIDLQCAGVLVCRLFSDRQRWCASGSVRYLFAVSFM